MQTPPPPVQPVNVEQVNTQKQNQDQNQGQSQNLQVAPAFNNTTDNVNNARSNSNSTVNQSPSMVNTQVNNHFDGRITYGDGISVPVPSLNFSLFADKFNDSYYYGGGSSKYGGVISVNIPLGGRDRVNKLIDSRNNTLVANELTAWTKLCTGLINSGVDVDYNIMPQFKRCQAFSKRTVTPPPPPPAPDYTEFDKRLQALQAKLEALKERNQQLEDYAEKITTESNKVPNIGF